MFNKDLTPIYFGSNGNYDSRVYVSKDAMKDAAVVAALEAMAKRNFEPLPTPTGGYWNISDRH